MFNKIIFLILFVFSCSSFARIPADLSFKQYIFSFQTNYYKTNKNFNGKGEIANLLPKGSSYTHILLKPEVMYTFHKDWAVRGSLDFAMASTDSENINGRKKNLGISDASLGLIYKTSIKSFHVQPQMKLNLAIFKVDESRASTESLPLLGEGATGFSIGSFVHREFMSHNFYIYSGFDYRTGGRAILFPWSFGLHKNISKFFYGLEIGGHRSLTEDSKDRTEVTSRTNNDSLRYFSSTPALTEIQVSVGFKFLKSISVGAYYSYPIEGRNTANGSLISVNLAWNSSFGKKIKPKKPFKADFDDLEDDFM